MTSSGCAICDTPSLDFLFVAKGYEIMACGRCGFAQVGSPPTDDELARLYEDLHVNHSRFRDARAAWRGNKSRLDFVKEFVPPGCSLLDAGCATGDFLALAKEHYATYGFDISEGAIAQ